MAQFAEEGIQFSVIPPDRIEEVLQFLSDNFYPDEPVCRSLAITRNRFTDGIYSDIIRGGSSVMATDSTGRIIGIRLTEVVDRDNRSKRWGDRFSIAILPALARIFGLFRMRRARKFCLVFDALIKELEYDVWGFFEQYNCQKLLSDMGLCTARESRVRGLGTELVKQAESVGREKGCELAINIVTGVYSGKVFRDKCHYTVVKELFYARFLDRKGNLHLEDTREHDKCFSCYKRLS